MKNIFHDKTAGVLCNLIAAAFAVVAMIAYAVAGRDSYGFVPMVEILLGFGVLSALIFSWHDFSEFGPLVTMLFFGSGFSVFLNSRFMYYSHQFYKIASDPITTAMIITTIALIGMIIFEIISGFMRWGEKRNAK